MKEKSGPVLNRPQKVLSRFMPVNQKLMQDKKKKRRKKRCSERKDEKEKITRLPTEPALYLLSVVLRTCCTRSHKTERRGRGWVSDDSEGKNEND